MGPVLSQFVKGLLNQPFEHLVFQTLCSLRPPRSADDLDPFDDPLGLVESAIILIVKNAEPNLTEHSLVLVESAILPDGVSK